MSFEKIDPPVLNTLGSGAQLDEGVRQGQRYDRRFGRPQVEAERNHRGAGPFRMFSNVLYNSGRIALVPTHPLPHRVLVFRMGAAVFESDVLKIGARVLCHTL